MTYGGEIMKNDTQNVYVINKRKGKVLMIIGALIMAMGVLTISASVKVGTYEFVIGFIILTAGKIKRWWHN